MPQNRDKFYLVFIIVFILRFSDSYGQSPQWEWANAISSSDHEEVNDLVVDRNTNEVYVAGEWKGDLSATFPAVVNPSTDFTATYGGSDGMVAKYDSTGALLWAFKLGGPNEDKAEAIDIDQFGNIYITGFIGTGASYFSGTSPHTSLSILDNNGDDDFFIAKYDSSGAFQWVKRSETDFGNVRGQDLCVTDSAVYACGYYDWWASFGSLFDLNTTNNSDVFLIKYKLGGEEQWIISAGSNDGDSGNGVIADETNVYLTGSFLGGNISIRDESGGVAESISNISNGSNDIYLSSFDSDGSHQWSQGISSSNGDIGWGIAMDDNNLYLTGEISDGTVFPGYAENPVPSSGGTDIFISSHSRSDGLTNWVSSLASSNAGDQRGNTINTNGNGAIYVAGEYNGELQFPQSVTLTSLGDKDAFFTSYDIQGEFRWAANAGSIRNEAGLGIFPGSKGSFYIGGFYDDELTLGPFTLPDENRHNGFLAKLIDTASIVLDTFTVENDYPCSAKLLTVGDTCSATEYDNLGSSDSGIPDPGCGFYYGGDVWFKTVVPPSGNIFVGTNTTEDETYPPTNGWMYRVGMAVYTGTCSSLSLEGCYSLNSGYNYRASSAFLFDKNPGDTIWIRVWEAFGNDFGSFSICTFDPGHYPAWNIQEELCGNEGIVDLETTLDETRFGFVDNVMGSFGIQDIGFITGAQDGAVAKLLETGDWMKLDLTDTIPAGEILRIYFRSNFAFLPPTAMTISMSEDDITYHPLSFKPETDMDEITLHHILTEHPTRYILIENDNAGGGGFVVDAIEYNFRGTRGGTWSGPGVSGSIFDPTGLSGSVSINYAVGGTNTFSDSTITTVISNSYAGILSGDTAVCIGVNEVVLRLLDHQGDVLIWESSTDGFASIAASGLAESSFTVSDLSEITSFRVVGMSGSCAPDTSNSITITVHERPVINPGSGGSVCGLEFQLQASPSFGNGKWTMSEGPGTPAFIPRDSIPDPLVAVSEYGTYTFTWTEKNGGCSKDSSVVVEFLSIPEANAGEPADICGMEYMLNARPSIGSGLWSLVKGPGKVSFIPTDTAPSVKVVVEEYGLYEFAWTEVLDACSGSANVEIGFHSQPIADAGPDQVLEYVFSTWLDAAVPDIGTGSWKKIRGEGQIDDPLDPLAIVNQLGVGENEFSWTIVSDVCEDDADSVVIMVNDIQLQTVITPNGDGRNDYLKFLGIDQRTGVELIIYNRWGAEVFRSNDYINDWDGKDQRGRELISDTYYYILKLSQETIVKSFVEIRR